MNTRLQVEHPVTEMITGFDLVEQMIRIAAGESLPVTQEEVKLKGWAIETRIYAEDPTRGFLPSSGRISEYKEPQTNPYTRVDSGVYEGGQVSMFYDPMIAKLITYGETRADAIENMQSALGEYVIRGISHNISFLEALISHKRFASGNLNTNFIAEEYPEGFFGAELTSDATKVLLAVAVHIYLEDARRASTTTGQIEGRTRQIGNRWVVNIDGVLYPVYARPRQGGYDIKHDAKFINIRSSWTLGNCLFQGTVDNRSIFVQIEYFAGGFHLTHAGSKVKVTVRSPRVAELDKFMPKTTGTNEITSVEAPISGMVVDIMAKEGEEVKKGQDLLILEAMKMENVIYAERDAIIKKIHINKGDSTSYGQTLIEYK